MTSRKRGFWDGFWNGPAGAWAVLIGLVAAGASALAFLVVAVYVLTGR